VSKKLHDLVREHGGQLYGDHAVLPGPGHSRRDRSLSVTTRPDGRLLYYSFADDPHDLVAAYLGLEDVRQHKAASRVRLTDRPGKSEWARKEARQREFCRAVWGEALPLAGSPAEHYLSVARGVTAPSPSLRFHPAAPLNYEGSRRSAALVALVQGHTSQAVGLHVTAILEDVSGKALGDGSRRMFGAVRCAAVRLSPPDRGEIALAEGIETALSFSALTGLPTWAALSTSGLVNFEPPPDIQAVTIAADGDTAGRKAAEALAERLGCRCKVRIASAPDGRDWNDVLREGVQ
jgi:hypothetical protein